MNRKAHALIAATLTISGLMASSSASACGFIACALRDVGLITEQQRKELDRLNHNLGNPVDHAIAAGANAIVPGSGAVIEAGYAIQRSGVLNGIGQAQQHGAAHPAPSHHVPHHGSHSGHHRPAPMLGNLCRTGMYYSFIAPQAVGNSCWNHAWNMPGTVSNW
jgi:hypothetical protein